MSQVCIKDCAIDLPYYSGIVDLIISHYILESDELKIPAISLREKGSGIPLATASVYLTGYDYIPNTVSIKNYSENEGMYEALVKLGFVSEVIDLRASSYVLIPICYMQGKLLKAWEEHLKIIT